MPEVDRMVLEFQQCLEDESSDKKMHEEDQGGEQEPGNDDHKEEQGSEEDGEEENTDKWQWEQDTVNNLILIYECVNLQRSAWNTTPEHLFQFSFDGKL